MQFSFVVVDFDEFEQDGADFIDLGRCGFLKRNLA